MAVEPGFKRKRRKRPGFETKIYLVMRRDTIVAEGQPNRVVLSAHLTRASAQRKVDVIPSTYIEKHIASK